MKSLLSSVMLLLSGSIPLWSQLSGAPDTLLFINFNNLDDIIMLPAPSGYDTDWVNWDGDQAETLCGQDTMVPGAWYREGDFGEDSLPAVNYAFTSCSWLVQNQTNNNWLITPPVIITDSTYSIRWRSASFQGPQFLDGYKVLLSRGSNLPGSGDFKDTLFRAAQMLGNDLIYSLDVNDYLFSEGYIHADTFEDAAYFYLDPTLGPDGLFHGRLEPHRESLKDYAGDTIYIAFVHDSQNDYILQIDDIVIANTISAVRQIDELTRFSIRPNPVRETALLSWELSTALSDIRLVISNHLGQFVRETIIHDASHVDYRFDARTLPPGIYYCSLHTQGGQTTTRRMIKM